jgi:hypothetical protein
VCFLSYKKSWKTVCRWFALADALWHYLICQHHP